MVTNLYGTIIIISYSMLVSTVFASAKFSQVVSMGINSGLLEKKICFIYFNDI